jgi:hypothetical protein
MPGSAIAPISVSQGECIRKGMRSDCFTPSVHIFLFFAQSTKMGHAVAATAVGSLNWRFQKRLQACDPIEARS